MSKLKYHQAFTNLTTLALLHLYSYMEMSSRFVPIKKRNELLIKFLKTRLALPCNVIIKKDMKVLIGGSLDIGHYCTLRAKFVQFTG